MYALPSAMLLSFTVTYAAAAASSSAAASDHIGVVPLVSADQRVVSPATLAVIVNLNDPSSVAIGNLYAKRRGVPQGNVVGLRLPRADFITAHLMQRELRSLAGKPNYASFLAYALAFDKPYRVGKNQSITSAFAQGIADTQWSGDCNVTPENPDRAKRPGEPLLSRPAFLLYGGGDPQSSVALIERGISSDRTSPYGKILLATTFDKARSLPREESIARSAVRFKGLVEAKRFADNNITATEGLIGLQTGLAKIEGLSRLNFLPGAFADHLTSFGGALNDKRGQTTVAEIMRAGATASYGTVREPCNFSQKFPDPELLIRNYVGGDSIAEAYWKSIGSSTEGLLIGEPLARPYPLLDATRVGNNIELRVNRQTLQWIESGDLFQVGSSKSTYTERNVAVYFIQHGKPSFIRKVLINLQSRVGDFVGTLSLEGRVDPNILLGVLPEL